MATVKLRTFPEPKEVFCPHCAKPVTLYDPEGSEYFVCRCCWSYVRYTDQKNVQTLQTLAPLKYEHILDPGTTGTLKGAEYKVLAYLEKKESGSDYEWREYMLYSYLKGYAFLAEYNGHWSFIAGIEHYPELKEAKMDGSAAVMSNVEYLEYNRYVPVITAMTGEFDWDAYEERVDTREFINPPWMLVREKNTKDIKVVDWYLGEYVTPKEIADGFNITMEKFPEQFEIGANQPNPSKLQYQQTLRISLAAVAVLLFIQIFCMIIRPSQVVMDRDVPLTPLPIAKNDTARKDSAAATSSLPVGTYEFQPQRTASFNITNGKTAVDLHLVDPVDNDWMEATVELVSEKDNQTWDLTQEIEYYSGYEDGDSWSEGSTSNTITLDDVPDGKYHINIYPYAGTQHPAGAHLTVTANVILWQNILITIAILALAPLAFWYFQRRFEVNRWMSSDFSPYNKTTGNDDDN